MHNTGSAIHNIVYHHHTSTIQLRFGVDTEEGGGPGIFPLKPSLSPKWDIQYKEMFLDFKFFIPIKNFFLLQYMYNL